MDTGPRVQVIARKVISLGPLGRSTLPGPNPFLASMDLVLDSPFPYSGLTALIWEVVIHSNNVDFNSFGSLDADSSRSSQPGQIVVTGQGCRNVTHTPSYTDHGGTLLINFRVGVGFTGSRANSPALLAIGSANPNLSVPGLCSNLYTNLVFVLPIGVTNASGEITEDMAGAATFVLPNALAGATLYTQAHVADPSQPGIPIENSWGVAVRVPGVNTSKVADLARIFNGNGGTAATEGTFYETTIGYGLVTQFTY